VDKFTGDPQRLRHNQKTPVRELNKNAASRKIEFDPLNKSLVQNLSGSGDAFLQRFTGDPQRSAYDRKAKDRKMMTERASPMPNLSKGIL
jgi:hypothetical protein